MTHLLRDIGKLPFGWFLPLFLISAGSLFWWEVLRLVTVPVPHRWDRWRRRLVPVAIVSTVLVMAIMGLRFAHFTKVI